MWQYTGVLLHKYTITGHHGYHAFNNSAILLSALSTLHHAKVTYNFHR